MPAYSILGATGSTGQELVKQLSSSPKNTINAFVRSRSKLENLIPSVVDAKNVAIFEGTPKDIPLLSKCFTHDEKPVDIIFMVIGVNENVPKYSVVQEVAHNIVAAINTLHDAAPSTPMPRVVFLSSVGANPRYSALTKEPMHWMLQTGLSAVYADLTRAQDYLREQPSWFSFTFVQPGGLVQDFAKGYTIKLERDGTEPVFLGYPDLAAGMIEIAENNKGLYDRKETSVVPATK
jgi:oxidoreductase AflX